MVQLQLRLPTLFQTRWAIAILIVAVGFAPAATAHETDQFSMPINREFADWGPLLNRWMHQQISRGVKRHNAKIRQAIERGKSREDIAELQTPEAITLAVWKEYPVAYSLIENLEKLATDQDLKRRFPSKVLSDRPEVRNVRQHFEIPYNPLRPWYAATINIYGVHLGTDKIGHFADMGMHYWKAYKKALAAGKSEHDAMRDCYAIATNGLLYSERGLMGFLTAGAYSNADLCGNFMGFLFYRNLTEAIELKGAERPPLLERDGAYWKLASHVRRDSDFFSLFFTDHQNEALNPSLYLAIWRGRLRLGVEERADKLLERHADRHGNRRPERWFAERQLELTTYYGVDYGHHGEPQQLVSIANSCFEPFDIDAPVKSRDNMGLTPLHRAAWDGRVDAVRRLLERGADVRAQVRSNEADSSEWGATPLHLAAGEGQVESATLLLQAGAEINAADDRGTTPLHRAVDHPDMIALLLNHGADANARDATGRTALVWSCDAPGDVYGGEPIDSTPTITLLIDAGAEVNAADLAGRTAIWHAASVGNVRAVQGLLHRDATLDVRDQFGETPLHALASHKTMPFNSAGAEATMKLLLKAGAAVDARDDLGRTPLHLAVKFSNLAITTLLLDAGANANAEDAYANTPLHLACRGGRQPIAEKLLEHGANVGAKNAVGRAALDESIASKNKELVRRIRAVSQSGAMSDTN